MLLEIENLVAGYGGKTALFGISLSVEEQEVVAVLGHNGAGKTTLLRAAIGLLRPQSGQIRLEGRDVTAMAPKERIRAGMAMVPEGGRVFSDLTVLENLLIGARSHGERRGTQERLERVFDLFPDLVARRHHRAGVLSGGQRQMLALGIALMLSPRILLLDEPSGGLAPVVVEKLFSTIGRINREYGMTVLIVEQNVQHALRLARRAVVLRTGRVVFEGVSAALRETEELRQVLLGV